MVIQATIEHMKSRPHEERRDFAALVSALVVGVLFVGWVILFVHNVNAEFASRAQEGFANAKDQTSSVLNSMDLSNTLGGTTTRTKVAQPPAPEIINIDAVPTVQ